MPSPYQIVMVKIVWKIIYIGLKWTRKRDNSFKKVDLVSFHIGLEEREEQEYGGLGGGEEAASFSYGVLSLV